jgi:hypothetical protein
MEGIYGLAEKQGKTEGKISELSNLEGNFSFNLTFFWDNFFCCFFINVNALQRMGN